MCDAAAGAGKGAGAGAAPANLANGAGARRMFCPHCAGAMERRTPPGDERERSVCTQCARVQYHNPKLVVGTVPLSRDRKRVLLAKRAIPPVGTWTIPAGFLEDDEDAESGAAREAWEECRAELAKSGVLLAVYSILRANQVQLVYQSTVLNEESVAPGIESLSVRMFAWDDIPWEELAFPTVKWALEHMRSNLESDVVLPQLRTKNFDGSFSGN